MPDLDGFDELYLKRAIELSVDGYLLKDGGRGGGYLTPVLSFFLLRRGWRRFPGWRR